MTWLELMNVASTWGMVGLIWFVQLVHYPLFAAYRPDDFPQTMSAHQNRTLWVVAPLMLAELATTLAVAWFTPNTPAVVGVFCVAVCWASTGLAVVPLHERLAGNGYDGATVRRLVARNWVRTAGWTLHGGLTLWLAALHV